MSFGQRLSLAQRNVEAAQLNLDSAVEFMNQLVRDFADGPQSMIALPPHPRNMNRIPEYQNGQVREPADIPRPYNKSGKFKKPIGRPRKQLALPQPEPEPEEDVEDFSPPMALPSPSPAQHANLKPVDGKMRINGLFIYPYFIQEFVRHMKPGTKKFKADDIHQFAQRVLGYDANLTNLKQALGHQAGAAGPKTLKSYGQGGGFSVRPGGDLAHIAH